MFFKSSKISKVSYFLSLLVMIILSSKAIAAEEDLNFPFTADSGKYWQYVSDREMGGVSDGKVTLEQDGEMYYARLTGNVSTKNNGGFIQLRSVMVKLMKFILQLMIEFIVETIIQQPSKLILIGK